MTLHGLTPDEACSVALLGADYPGLRPRLAVAEGDLVGIGQVLFVDAKRPAVAFVSPIRGRVAAIRFGPRRMLSEVVIDPVEIGPKPLSDRMPPDGDLRGYLLTRGMWPAFVARPFGGPPDPDARPDAIVVSAVPSSPESAAPHDVLSGREAAFAGGLEALSTLTTGNVQLCVDHGSILSDPDRTRIRVHARRASRQWRTASGQVARVHPVGASGQVWTIGFQDVIALGHLLATGLYDPIRTVALRRSGAAPGRTMQLPLGANLRQAFGRAKGLAPDRQVVSGSERQGRPAAYLGRYHDAAGTAHVQRHGTRAAPKPLIPFTPLNGILPARILAVPLMRALSIGDARACEKLGCLELLEEDVAPLSALCVSGTDYGRCLRTVLDQLRKDAA